MDTKIYSVFPACGKTYMYENQDEYDMKILDSDSSEFSWIEVDDGNNGLRKERNPDFPNNYIAHIKEQIGKYDYIFVSSHESVRKALNEAGIDFTIVYPKQDCLTEWIGRCYLRELNGKNGFPIKVLVDNWNDWISGCFEEGIEHEEIVLNRGEYLSDYVLK